MVLLVRMGIIMCSLRALVEVVRQELVEVVDQVDPLLYEVPQLHWEHHF